jgi:hypothetical protein
MYGKQAGLQHVHRCANRKEPVEQANDTSGVPHLPSQSMLHHRMSANQVFCSTVFCNQYQIDR